MHPLRFCGIPLGGIGAGTVELRSDGLFHEWQIMNNKPLSSGPEAQIPCDGAYFGCVADGRAAFLNDPVDRLNDPYSFPYVKYPGITVKDRWPFFHLLYRWNDFPVRIKLTAFSSFVPQNVKKSSLPGAIFEFEVVNTTEREIHFAFFHAQRNLTAYSQKNNPSVVIRRHNRLLFSRRHLRPRANDSGTMAITLLADDAEFSHAVHIKSTREFWEPLLENYCLADHDYSETVEIGNAGAETVVTTNLGIPLAAIALTITLKPKEKRKFISVLTWSFPAFHELPYPPKHISGHCIGHYYNNFFANAGEVADYFVKNLSELKRDTSVFRKLWQSTSLPSWMQTAVTAQLPTLFKSSWLDRSGRFGIWEGLGLCGLQTVDVGFYGSFAVLHLFPELEKTQLSLTAYHADRENGHIPHSLPGNFHCSDIDDRQRVDLLPDFLLMLFRDAEWLGDLPWAGRLWPLIKRSISYYQRYLDKSHVVYDRGADQTYDQFPLRGSSAMTGFLQVGALRAAAKLAVDLQHDEEAKQWAEQAEKVRSLLQERLWNGRWFSLSNDLATGVRNEGVMVDQCSGDWFLRQCGEPGLISDEQRESVFDSILEYCRRDNGFLANCSWPHGDGVKIGTHTSNQADWPWSGVEYAFAANLALADRVPDAWRVARDVFMRYERTGLRFKHIECGAHYYRALSVWTLYDALCGQFWNGADDCRQHPERIQCHHGD